MTGKKISITQARKLLGKTGDALNDDQISKLLDVLTSLADYSLGFIHRNTVDVDGSKK